MSMLQIHILLIAAEINKDRVFLSTFLYRSDPVCTTYTCEVAVAIKVAPTRIADVWQKTNFCQLFMFMKVEGIFSRSTGDAGMIKDIFSNLLRPHN